jgi:hypothetical protein
VTLSSNPNLTPYQQHYSFIGYLGLGFAHVPEAKPFLGGERERFCDFAILTCLKKETHCRSFIRNGNDDSTGIAIGLYVLDRLLRSAWSMLPQRPQVMRLNGSDVVQMVFKKTVCTKALDMHKVGQCE